MFEYHVESLPCFDLYVVEYELRLSFDVISGLFVIFVDPDIASVHSYREEPMTSYEKKDMPEPDVEQH